MEDNRIIIGNLTTMRKKVLGIKKKKYDNFVMYNFFY